jgi:ADP-ribosylglycohydrolase
MTPDRESRFRGILLGTAVGDALGLPAEGISKRRVRKLFPGRPRHRFLFGRGMVSDDTDHTVFVAQSLLARPGAPDRFARRLAWCLRLWLLTLPAGVGFATLRSILRLWLGMSYKSSGVHSAGNGPAMRAAPVGAYFYNLEETTDAYVEACTRVTHTDPRALTGARAVAHLAGWAVGDELNHRPDPETFATRLRAAGRDEEWLGIVDGIEAAQAADMPVEAYASSIGLERGVGGYVYHTVPVSVYAWYRHFGDFEATLTSIMKCGGDTDTTGAISGALAGAVVGEGGIPRDWLAGIAEWPRNLRVLREIGDRLGERAGVLDGGTAVRYFWPGLILRNIAFLLVVLVHGLRRALPPY